MSINEEYLIPDKEYVDITPELVAEIVGQLPPHAEGQYGLTVKTDSLRRLLENAGAKVVVGYHQNPHAHEKADHGND